MSYAPLLTVSDLRKRAIMPAADLRRLLGLQWKKQIDDASASAATAEASVGVVDDAANLIQVLLVPAKPLTADAVNNATISLWKRTNGGAAVLLASVTSSAISWTTGAPVALTIAAAPIAAGDALSVTITKAGTGVVVPAFELFTILDVNFVTTAIDDVTDEMISRLAKRYAPPTAAKPWPSPVANVLQRWAATLVTRVLYHKRGFSPASEDDAKAIEDAADAVEAKLKEAADGKDGLFEIALADDGKESVTMPTPGAYAEASPYTASRLQRKAGRLEDANTSEND